MPVVLPPVQSNARYSPAPQQYGDVVDTPFGYTSTKQRAGEKPRSLSIQSLISSPGLEESGQGRKRKGSDGAEDGGRTTRGGSIVPTSVSIEDPDVREVVEALGGLKGGEFFLLLFWSVSFGFVIVICLACKFHPLSQCCPEK